MAVSVAKQAYSENAQPPGIKFMADCMRIGHMVDPSIQHKGAVEFYMAYRSSREYQIRNRRDQILLVNSRPRMYIGLRAYKNLLDECESTSLRTWWLQRCPTT